LPTDRTPGRFVTASSNHVFTTIWEEQGLALSRGQIPNQAAAILMLTAHSTTSARSAARLEHEYLLADYLDPTWAAKPLELVREEGRTALVLHDPGGASLESLLTHQLELKRVLRIAVGLARAASLAHRQGLIHKDIRPANVLVDANDNVWLTGFGIASRLPRDRQAMVSPEVIAGTLSYMAPEQTGRMNRSIDARSDLYSIGITIYRMLAGRLPFNASDALEWIHCHVARQPSPPGDLVKDLPDAINAIVMKLLSKSAEDRYQTAAGLEVDLQYCLTAYEIGTGRDDFELATRDISDRLIIPEALYGRKLEVAALVSAFNRVVASGKTELVLVSGYSGIGKSSIVNELHRAMTRPRALFATGKFDQYKRTIPYSTLAQALRSLIQDLLTKSDAEVARWRSELTEALGLNGQLMVNLIPDLARIIGEQPPVPELPPRDTEHRFQTTFRRLLSAFAKPEHPLVLFLDDLQWLDTATVDLIEHLATHDEVSNLLLIGAYRDNEVSQSHPLTPTLMRIKRVTGGVHELVLSPLQLSDIGELVAETLRTTTVCVRRLAELVHERTGGNPFFAIQFITDLVESELIIFDRDRLAWQWDIERIKSEGITENVADLMAAKLTRLPEVTQRALGRLACLGNTADNATLIAALGVTERGVHQTLMDAERARLILRINGAYIFAHDRVREAAYALLGESKRARTHLLIARALIASSTPETIEGSIFDIVSQFDRCLPHITSREERQQVSTFYVIAGNRAKRATAYTSALTYFTAGSTLLPDDSWEQAHNLAFEIELAQGECEYLTGDLISAENRLEALAERAANTAQRAAVTRLRLNLYTNLDRSETAIEVGLSYLKRIGVDWTTPVDASHVVHEYDALWKRVGDRSIETLVDLPTSADPDWRATMDVLTALTSPALFIDANIFRLVVGRMALLSLEHGNSDGSCLAYAWLGSVLGSHFNDYESAAQFGKLAIDLVEKHNLDRFAARVHSVFGAHIAPWSQPLRACRAIFEHALGAAERTGDLAFIAFSQAHLVTKAYSCGAPLDEVQRDAEQALQSARRMQFGLVVNILTGVIRPVRKLRGSMPDPGEGNGGWEFDEVTFEQNLTETPAIALAACWYWIRKLQANFLIGDVESAIDAASKASSLLWTSLAEFEIAEYHFYAALAHAAACDSATPEQIQFHLDASRAHLKHLDLWARQCPENFIDRSALVGAEIARLEQRDLDAIRLYEIATSSAATQGFLHNEAIANELAGKFHVARGFQTIAKFHLKSAYSCYLRWGAFEKARQLARQHPHLPNEVPGTAQATDSAFHQIDLATVVKMSQAISGEIVLDRLIERLMSITVQHAGAVRGVLLLMRNDELRVEAEATTQRDDVVVNILGSSRSVEDIPISIVRYVARSEESIIIDDAATQNRFSSDDYIHRRKPRSILCLPLRKQRRLIGILYLENHLAPYVFTQSRIEVLGLLAAQAAISLETAHLYLDLQGAEERARQSEREFRQAFDTIPALAWSSFPSGEVEYLNKQWHEYIGLRDEQATLEELLPFFHPDDLETVNEKRKDLQFSQANFEFEARIRRADGQFRRFLIRATPLLDGTHKIVKWYGTNTDIEDLRRAEEELRRTEAGLRRAQSELARVARLTTIGELATSIAHEVNQPLMAIATNAETCVLWLAREHPDHEEARKAAERVVDNAHRASEIVRSIRALARKSPADVTEIGLNQLLRGTLDMMGTEIRRHEIALQTSFEDGLDGIMGDRVQLQQVIVNLILNAIEAMRAVAGRTLLLHVTTARYAKDYALVRIADTGEGLDSNSITKIFEPLFTTKEDGLGMGLSICRSIIDAHGGNLWALPQHPHGSSFQFTVPLSSKRP
jgi:PAS domain S-box-containing protein